MINLRDIVKDQISGFSGMVTSRTEFINGCVRIGVQPTKLTKEGKPMEVEIFDEQQLDLVKKSKPKKEKASGGPRPAVHQRSVKL